MSRLIFGSLFALCLSVFTVGCGGSGTNTVMEDTRTQAEIDAEDEAYEEEMNEEDVGE